MSGDSPRMKLRSSTKDIRRRRSIHENSPIPESDLKNRDKSPFVLNRTKESSRSPSKRENLYPDLEDMLNDSVETVSDHEDIEHINEPNITTETKFDYSKIWLLLAIIVIISGVFVYKKNESNQDSFPSDTHKIDCSKFLELKKKFPYQNAKLFDSLKVSTEGLYNRLSKPSVFTFFSTDQQILDDLIRDVVQTTKSCIRQTNDPINLKYSDLNKEKFMNDYTKIIGEYKNELLKRNIMVINNLDGLATKIVPSLHSFADTYNPLVQKSIIYITIKVPKKPEGVPAEYIFTHLQQKWVELPSNIRGPLIARLLDQTFFLEPQN